MINKIPIKNFVIIGSYPLNIRYSKDIDLVCYKKDVQCDFILNDEWSGYFEFEGRRIELLFADNQESFQYLLKRHSFTGLTNLKSLATLEQLYCIKRGHITFPSKNWEKHIGDLHLLGRLLGYYPSGLNYLNDVNSELINLHKKSTELRLGKQRTPKLNGVSKEKFFDDSVKKYYIHDDLHVLFSHTGRPMYEKMQKDLNSVQCDKNLWDKFSHDEKIKTVLEECYVISSERKLIPTIKGDALFTDTHECFKWALMRVSTTLTSGWFRDFSINNYFEILNNCDHNYYEKLKELK